MVRARKSVLVPEVDALIAERIASLEAGLRHVDDERSIRACVTRYMTLCDQLDANTPLDELKNCFTKNAVWLGKGARYGAAFGGYTGRREIGAMFKRYMKTPAHFALNVHFLCSELITPLAEGEAAAEWVMLQTSTFADGSSHLNAARLTLRMARCKDGCWRIARFETENLFSRPVSHWQSDEALPVPAARAKRSA